MDFRTDLAIERREILGKNEPDGVKSRKFTDGDVKLTVIRIESCVGAEALGKPVGTYISADIPDLVSNPADSENTVTALARQIESLLPKDGTVLVAGLGNTDITPDAVGPKSVSMVLATRHISSEVGESIGLENLRSVAGFIPGVMGKTGVESAESIKGIVNSVKPSAVIVIDALAARKMTRLGRTVQMSDTGIIPGSGVGNSRSAINMETVGVPVISIGIPTVVDAQTLVNDLTDDKCKISNEENKRMIVTPREIDIVVQRASELIGLAVNKALQPELSIEEILMLVSD